MIKLNWTNTLDIAIELADKYPNIDPLSVRFTDLHQFIYDLDGFVGKPNQSNEKVLEAIQMAWINEK
jgi:FeS assembly protein IscX